MDVRDWALITFTILVQMSVGSMWVLLVAHFFAARKYGEEAANRLSDRTFLVLVPVIALAFIASLLHLGNPINAYRAVTNLASSWLSREIFFGVIFAILAFVYAFLQWRKIGSFVLRNIIALVAAIVGLVLVYSMSHVYMIRTQPAWNSWATPVSFFVTAFLLGVLAMGVAFVANYAYLRRKTPDCAEIQCDLMRDALRWVALAAVLLLGVEMVVLPLYVASLSLGTVAGLASLQLMIGSFGWALALRVALAFIGAGVFAVLLYQNAMKAGHEKLLSNLTYAAFILVLVAEVLNRYLFYVSHVRIGI